jgi:hypothetical protein
MSMGMSNVVQLESFRPTKTLSAPPPRPWPQTAATWCLDWMRHRQEINTLLTRRERDFLMNVETWARPLSPYQKAWLVDIITKIRPVVDNLTSQPTPPSAA